MENWELISWLEIKYRLRFIGRAEKRFPFLTRGACPAQPISFGNRLNSVARLMHADVARVAEDHLVAIFAVQSEANVAGDLIVEFDARGWRERRWDRNI